MALRLLLDSADPAAWAEWLPSGLFHGVTTNPTLLRRAGQPCRLDHLAVLTERALALGAREVHLQAWAGIDAGSGSAVSQESGDHASDALAERYLACGRALAALAPRRVWVKLPITRAGALAARQLLEEAIPITFTACYEPAQVLLAAALGADYIAPYLGRIGDLGRDGHAELTAMQRCVAGIGSPLRLLVASLRQPQDLARLAAEGLDTFTISPAIVAGLFASTATIEAAEQFEGDALGG
ncbi:transaldolase family protein [Vulcanococcus limneticus]|uniref:transaldolase family protein n=1 Tax=Vulcanococcus limneticus TaxID=2170428 RepID=UPI00398BCA60